MPKYRLNLELLPREHQNLLSLKQRTDAASITEVIRRALSLYDNLVKYTEDDWVIIARRKKPKPEETAFIIL